VIEYHASFAQKNSYFRSRISVYKGGELLLNVWRNEFLLSSTAYSVPHLHAESVNIKLNDDIQ